MKRRKRFIFLLVALFFALTLMSFEKGEASECYLMYVNWDCLKGNQPDLTWKKYTTSMYVAKHRDGSIDLGGFVYGVWSEYGRTLLINFPVGGCNPLYFGADNAGGFMICSQGSSGVTPPGCWHWKKVKASDKTCWWMNEGHSSSSAEVAERDEALTTVEETDE